jgi:hypothetical protein
MITKDTALRALLFHQEGCKRTVGPRGGIKVQIITWWKNGSVKIWERSPERFCVPVRYGLKDYAHITEDNAEHYHAADDCPLNSDNLCPICGKKITLKGSTLDGRLIGSCGDAFTVIQWEAK